RDFLRSTADWQWETDAALRLVHVTVAAAARHGVDATAHLGQPLTRLFAIEPDGQGDLPMLSALSMRERFEDQPAKIRATGQAVWLSAAPRLATGGGFAGLAGAVRMAEQSTGAARSEPVTDVNALTTAFSTRLDKALRAPLGRIIANADSINAQSEGPLRQDYADYAADIATAGRHLLGLVDDLVDLQAIERPDFTVASEPIDLADVARRAAGLLQVRAAAANVRIDRPGLQDALPATGEFRRALQVLVNLIGNAVRYSPEGGMVWIRAEREGSIAAVIVADQGRGISIDDQQRIFAKFERVDTAEPGGSGLGLYIARRLARAMGGDVTVDSAPGQGARFVFTLPARDV
ncbi:MAG: HAMP domain-containing histidine kinase, partial [Sphingomonas sp.]|nr:HAMP domain-containing histidine kinase [Sphingomonas sp.]